jgi:hypothetical protein
MIPSLDVEVERLFSKLGLERDVQDYRKRSFLQILAILSTFQDIQGILWGGSYLRGSADPLSDCDVFCHANYDSTEQLQAVVSKLEATENVRSALYQGYWPWFGHLWTVFFSADVLFTVDLGFVQDRDATAFFWEPTGMVIKDQTGVIGASIAGNLARGNTNQFKLDFPCRNIFFLLSKIQKNVVRGHFWNALEYLNQARRYLMLMLRDAYVAADAYLGRPDRNIEDVLPRQILVRLQETVADTSETSIVRASSTLAIWCIDLSAQRKWDLSSDLRNEILRLNAWFRCRLND